MKRVETLNKLQFKKSYFKVYSLFFMRKLIVVFVFLLFICSCSNKYGTPLENGDFLFVSASSGSLSSAIDRVTQTKKATHYSHVGVLEKTSGEFWVLHAGTRNGSERIHLDSFLLHQRSDSNFVDVYRLKEQYRSAIPEALETAKKWLGKPYNYSYILSDDKLYCSDFVQRSFAKDSIFKLKPMTFINPKTGKIDASWVKFYQDQGIEVPEGKLGCNPNNMAASDKISRIGRIAD